MSAAFALSLSKGLLAAEFCQEAPFDRLSEIFCTAQRSFGSTLIVCKSAAHGRLFVGLGF